MSGVCGWKPCTWYVLIRFSFVICKEISSIFFSLELVTQMYCNYHCIARFTKNSKLEPSPQNQHVPHNTTFSFSRLGKWYCCGGTVAIKCLPQERCRTSLSKNLRTYQKTVNNCYSAVHYYYHIGAGFVLVKPFNALFKCSLLKMKGCW